MLLKKGDSFYVPPGNIYRLENHSTAKSCMLFWTIIKPIEMEAPKDEEDGERGAEEEGVDDEEDDEGASSSTTRAIVGGVAPGGHRRHISDDDDM